MSATTKPPQPAVAQISLSAIEIVRSFVQRPDQVTVEVLELNGLQAELLLRVHSEDLDILLAHEGRILRALRTFIYAMAAKNNLLVKLQTEATRPPPDSTLP